MRSGSFIKTVLLKTDAKIIKLQSVELYELVKACQKKQASAQRALFERYAPILLGICRRYFKQTTEAEDALMISFSTIFQKIQSFQNQGSFEGWMKRITVNSCLMELRKKRIDFAPLEGHVHEEVAPNTTDSHLIVDDILSLLDQLPQGYRLIFNLYAIEGYKHREIADMLNISINTSKSQLIQARKKLRAMIENQSKPKRDYEKYR